MAKPSSVKKVPRKKIRVSRKRPNMGYGLFMTGLVAFGSFLVVISRDDEISAKDAPGVAIGEHWHAFLGVNICGEWVPSVPPYEAPTGVHSHGDGFLHMHPRSSSGAHERATVGLFMKQARGDNRFNNDSIEIEGRKKVENGDQCKELKSKEKEAGVRWSVNGSEKPLGSDPSNYIPNDGDIIAVAFLPKDVPIGEPPGAKKSPSDLAGEPDPGTAPTTAPPAAPADGATTTTVPAAGEKDGEGSEPTTTTTK